MLLALIGLLLTVIWLLGGIWYVAEAIGFENLLFLLPSELGQMATGYLLPLVLLWLVLGYLHIGQRLRRLEEALWEIAAVRLARNSGGGSPAPGDQGWLDLEGGSRGAGTGSAAPRSAVERPRSLHAPAGSEGVSAAPAGASPTWGQRGTRDRPAAAQPAPGEQPRRGGLASEVFSSRMREGLAEKSGARPHDPGSSLAARQPEPAASRTAATKQSAAKPSPPKPTPLKAGAAKPVPQKAERPKPSASQPSRAAVESGPSAAPQQSGETTAEEPASNKASANAPQAPAAAPVQPASDGSSGAVATEPTNEAAPAAASPSEPPEASPAAEAAGSKPVGFRHMVRITSMELNTIAMDIATLLCRDVDHAQALKSYDKGEKDVFFDLLNTQLGKQKPAEALKRLRSVGGDELLINYLRKFDALVTESKGLDRSGALAKSLEAMPIGRLNTRLQALRAESW